ncbi:DNA repair protein RecN [Desulfosoma caldarium]|uniref:DNA repair protein RecN n=1 Tax=Desulfosoma caldarium TaxID=610254 RepID=A0A3N1UF57_9BACT|nr:DNA repair protein RecN [Desulfosoma caldarium]ROQ89894.1 DNA replication and repair protein RecN [Desulfosoma caldarium]
MLSELLVHNFAIISRLHVAFEPGFTVITGETGAGKSILVGAVNLLLGGRASQEMIRTGADEATVEALFTFESPDVLASRLRGLDAEPSTELIIKRTVSRSGRNRVFINGRLATLAQLQALATGLISISGQHEHQILLNPEIHLDLLDQYGNLGATVAEVGKAYAEWTQRLDALKRLQRMKAQRQEQMDFLRFQLQELEAARLVPHEDEELQAERKRLQHAATLHDAAETAHRLLYRDHGSVLEKLGEIAKHLETIAHIDPAQKPALEHVEQARIHAEELSFLVQQYAGSIRFDPARLAEVEDRLAVLGRLAKKYGPTVADMIQKRDELRKALGQDADVAWEESALRKEAAEAEGRLRALAEDLSRKRQAVAEKLRGDVQDVLARLDLPEARFDVAFCAPSKDDANDFAGRVTAKGIDRVEFLLSANPGEDLKALAKVASGGELSRILLALKTLLSRQSEAETLIFDEVDTGIGGRTAELVGRQLQRLSERFQVLCITHLPQIACFGTHHYRVLKQTTGQTTQTAMARLSPQERVKELARMLGGVSITEKTLAHAREWLERAHHSSL